MADILIVEDNEPIRNMLKETLELEGFTVFEAKDGEEALERWHDKKPDLIITDILMPKKEGLGLITEIRKLNPESKIIAVSGGGPNISSQCNLELAGIFGAVHTFPKPLDIDLLLQKVRELTE